MNEEIPIDDELLRQFRWRYVCLFTFKPGVKRRNAIRRVRGVFQDVQRAESTDISWIAVVDENPYEGPFVHVILAGIKAAFRDHVAAFNRNAAHCHLLHSDLRAGLRVGYPETEHPGIASFRSALQTARFGVESELYRSDLWTASAHLPEWLEAILTLKRRKRQDSQKRVIKAKHTRTQRKGWSAGEFGSPGDVDLRKGIATLRATTTRSGFVWVPRNAADCLL